jgi:hypothetical protein
MKHVPEWSPLSAALALIALMGCASSKIHQGYESQWRPARPSVVLVYNFGVAEGSVSENQSIVAKGVNSFSLNTAEEREAELSREVQEALMQDLVDGINGLGISARIADTSPPPDNAFLLQGQFTNIDEGNRLRRNIIGFGSGQSTLDTYVRLVQVTPEQFVTLMSFGTHSDSGAMPGALVTGGVGAAAGASTAAMLGTNAGLAVVKGYRSQVSQLARSSANQTVAYLSQYFAQQGWIDQDKVRNPQVSNR